MKRTALMLVWLAAVAVFVVCGPSSPPAVAKKGGGGGGNPPPAPSFRYEFLMIHDDNVAEVSYVKGMNNHGDVVGEYLPVDGGVSVPFMGNVVEGMVDLNSFVNPDENVLLRGAAAINDACQVVGWGYYFPDPDTHVRFAFRFTPPADGQEYGTLETIGNPGDQITGIAINNNGDVAGRMSVEGAWRAFICTEEDALVDLSSISPLAVQGFGLSDRVDGTLTACGAGSPLWRAWRFTGEVGNLDAGTVQDLGTLRSDNTGEADAQDINDSGQVAGTADAERIKGNDNAFAFLDTPGTGMVSLGTLATTRDWNDSQALGLNNLGEVVGMSLYNAVPEKRAFVYLDQYGILDLTQLTDGVPAAVMDGDYFVPRDINDSGDIAGPLVDNFNFSNGVPKAFLLIRVAAP